MEIQKNSLVNITTNKIKQYILENNLKPNDKFFTEKELVNQLQVSRTVVREALISLQSVGILYIRHGGGIYISDTSIGSISNILKHHYETFGVKIKELVEIRKIIEMGALRLIIEKEVNLNLVQLNDINESYLQSIINNKNAKEFDITFHRCLIKSANNKKFYKFSKIINEYFSFVKIDLIEGKDALLKSYHQHAKIIQALSEKNLCLAQNVMTEHFRPIYDYILEMEE